MDEYTGKTAEIELDTSNDKRRERLSKTLATKWVPRMVEETDEDDVAFAAKPKAQSGILEEVNEEAEMNPDGPKSIRASWQSAQLAREAAKRNSVAEQFWINDGWMFPEQAEEDLWSVIHLLHPHRQD
jgi:hypothetical protein